MKLFYNLQNAINSYAENNAFCINGIFYTYADLAKAISSIRKAIVVSDEGQIGLVTNDDLETYAGIIALWLEGKWYVPLNPDNPIAHNQNIIDQVQIKTILDSTGQSKIPVSLTIISSNLQDCPNNLIPKPVTGNAFAYALFTSGTTGMPKGVPISRDSLACAMEAIKALGINIDQHDRCLQMSELTFDVSISSFLYPLLYGACVFTIPKGKIKFSYVYELIERYELTVVQLVPSLLNYLRPYFSEISFPFVKYCTLTAEALPKDLGLAWASCIPNSRIINLYGPTENTIWSTAYTLDLQNESKSYNGIICIGKFMEGTNGIITDGENNPVPLGEKGELCLTGKQLTPGYFNKDELTQQSFFYKDGQRYYKTGDLCFEDEDGDLLYIGRIDSEVEFHCNEFLKDIYAVAVVFQRKNGNSEIGLVIESEIFNQRELISYLSTKLPSYMVPSSVLRVTKMPLNSNGKIDRNLLIEKFKS
jgi:non-ribosomal peptide synthetase component F